MPSWNKQGVGLFAYAANSDIIVTEILPEGESNWSLLAGVKLQHHVKYSSTPTPQYTSRNTVREKEFMFRACILSVVRAARA